MKVKASFGGLGERGPVAAPKPVIVDPAISANLDNATLNRLSAYLKAVNAEWAVVGYVYKTSDSQLTAGTAVFSVKTPKLTPMTLPVCPNSGAPEPPSAVLASCTMRRASRSVIDPCVVSGTIFLDWARKLIRFCREFPSNKSSSRTRL